MHKHFKSAALAMGIGAFVVPPFAPAAAGTYTDVTCKDPVSYVSTGLDGFAARWELHCNGGSTAPNISNFSFRVDDNPNVAQLLEHVFGDFVLSGGAPKAIVVKTDLGDTSGNAWGCGGANCRIIHGLHGF